MSIYSGFSTRLQESQYNVLIQRLISLLQFRVKANMNHQEINDYSWGKKFTAVYKQMVELELHKYLEPKFSKSCEDIAKDFYRSPRRMLINYPSMARNLTIPKNSARKIKKGKKVISRHRETPVKTNYYGNIMNSYLKKGRMSHSPEKIRKKLDYNHHEFWLIDDKIEIIK